MHSVNTSAESAWKHQMTAWEPSSEVSAARLVQTRLLRPSAPPVQNLELGAWYQPARVLGGDFYDFIDLGSRHVGLLIGDVSGKGISAALMMASLQASLRTHLALHLDLAQSLESVNDLFCAATEAHHFATLFLGSYDPGSHYLRYVNCGHHAPLLLRHDRSVERLRSTSTVLGIFPRWECVMAETRLLPGDTLLLYTDGMTETVDTSGEEYGEQRLLESVMDGQHLPLRSLIDTVVSANHGFYDGPQQDDQTLVIARPRVAGEATA